MESVMFDPIDHFATRLAEILRPADSVPAETELLTLGPAAALAGVSPDTWNRLVKSGKAPAPVADNPRRWDATKVADWGEWNTSLPTDEVVRATGELVDIARSGGCWQTFLNLQEQNLIKEGVHFVRRYVQKIRKDGRRNVYHRVYCVKTEYDLVLSSANDRRSESAKSYWKGTSMHREGGRTLLRARAVLDLIEKHTGMRYHYCTLLRWTGIAKHGDKNAPVCVHFANECLMAVFRDQKWNPLQSGEKGERAWYQDQIETVCANIKALQSDPTGTLLCGIRETWLLTGVPVSDLARPKVREELGLETILVPGKSSCQRREGASGKKTWMRQTGRLRFIRSSVERYRKTHENVPKVKKLPRRLMRPGHAAKVLAVDPATVRLWHKERILDGPVDSMVYWTTRGIRCGHPVTKRSVRAAQIVLQSVAGDVDNAGQLLRAMRDQDGGPVTVNAAKRAIGVLDSVGGAVAKACELIRTLPDDTTGPADNRSRCPKPPFLPSPFQKRCLDALKGKFLTATQLQQALGNVHREDLYARGIRPLMQAGVILNLRRPGAGYYRPDAPPPEIANFLEHPCNS